MASLSITHLNDDTSWVLAWKDDEGSPPFNIVVDPWLTGAQVDYVPFFSRQSHVVPPAMSSLSSLQDTLEGGISCILLTHEFTDHTHRETLSTTPSRAIPVLGHPNAVSRVKKWKIFDGPIVPFRIFSHKSGASALPDPLAGLAAGTGAIQQVSADSSKSKHPGLPMSVAVLYIPTDDWLDPAGNKLHGLTVLTFTAKDHTVYSILYSPHGLPTSALEPTIQALQNLTNHKCLALVHGFDDVRIPVMGKVNLGVASGKGIVERLKPAYWLRTHDELKEKEGIVGATLKRERRSSTDVQSALPDSTPVVVKALESGQTLTLV